MAAGTEPGGGRPKGGPGRAAPPAERRRLPLGLIVAAVVYGLWLVALAVIAAMQRLP